ncbi:MAG TPA: response regulator [Candidatus Brocadiia bacterium]|nr:response regulator [Candidatus Brocadiales bacterium]
MEKILIIDGNDDQRRLCEIELKSEGYEVITVRNGWEALLETKNRVPDVVVLDIMIPGMDGIELLSKLISINRNLPIIIHTSTDDYRDNFMTWCADAYITKSLDLMELKDKIRELLDKSKRAYV